DQEANAIVVTVEERSQLRSEAKVLGESIDRVGGDHLADQRVDVQAGGAITAPGMRDLAGLIGRGQRAVTIGAGGDIDGTRPAPAAVPSKRRIGSDLTAVHHLLRLGDEAVDHERIAFFRSARIGRLQHAAGLAVDGGSKERVLDLMLAQAGELTWA